jgi:hypothetical protein
MPGQLLSRFLDFRLDSASATASKHKKGALYMVWLIVRSYRDRMRVVAITGDESEAKALFHREQARLRAGAVSLFECLEMHRILHAESAPSNPPHKRRVEAGKSSSRSNAA